MPYMRTFLLFLIAAGQLVADDKSALLQKMDARAAHYGDVSRQIWDFAEVGYKENQSAELLKSELRSAGFAVAENVAGIPTAFTATWGQGRPVIAIMGEYDALPGLSQEDIPEHKPRVNGGPGHGCGHNLLGAASLLPPSPSRTGWPNGRSPASSASMARPPRKAGAASCT